MWVGQGRETVVSFFCQNLLCSVTKLFQSNVLSIYIYASSGGVCTLSFFYSEKKSMSPAKGISDIREQVGKVL